MWVLLAFVSALCLGFYDISKKVSLRDNAVVDVLAASVLISSIILLIPLLFSRLMPEMMLATPFYVPRMDVRAHMLTILKSGIVLSSWIFAYISLKHLPISLVSPWQATRPMWTLIGALLIFGERLNNWQWTGVILAIGSILLFSIATRKHTIDKYKLSPRRRYLSRWKNMPRPAFNFYYICLALAILIGSCSGLYDKYMMRRYDHNAVQVYYTFYQAVMMLIVWIIYHYKQAKRSPHTKHFSLNSIGSIVLIAVFLVISDNVYMLALQDPDSMIAVVSTIRRGGTIIGFAYGLLFLHEKDPWKKILCMVGILAGLTCLAMGSIN